MAIDIIDENYYRIMNPDVAQAVDAGIGTLRQHFELYGMQENRQAVEWFNPVQYLTAYADVAAAIQNGLTNAYQHFLNFGINEERAPIAGFDADYYLSQNQDIAQQIESGQFSSAVYHFIHYGINEIRNYNPEFNLVDYVNSHVDVADAINSGAWSPLHVYLQQTNSLVPIPTNPSLPDTGPVPEIDAALIDAIMLDLADLLASMPIPFDPTDLQQQILNSGLVTPDKVGPDGLYDPEPLVIFVLEYFGMPQDFIDIALGTLHQPAIA
ncbi:hypothetical protein ACMHYJ_01470 [Castellaniella hirudinis]|uniref:hypothetical protein n=1 Tax=Castellaniella hirudinis TaxID=1144617 RepID=UPI0039C2CC9D